MTTDAQQPVQPTETRQRGADGTEAASVASLTLPELQTRCVELLEAIAIHLDALRRTLSRDVDDKVSRLLLCDATELRAVYAEAWRRGVRL